MPALSSGTGAGQCAGGRCAADRAADRAAARGGTPRRAGGTRGDRGPVRAQLATDSPHRPAGAGRPSDPVAADTSVTAGETAADRDDVADDGGGVRQWLFECAPVQRRVHQALSDAADASAQESDRRRDGNRRERDVGPADLVSAAVRLEGRPRVSESPRAHRDRARDGSLVRADRAAGKSDGLDPCDAIEEATCAAGGVHAQPDACAAGAARPRASVVRSRRAAGRDCEASPEGRAPGARGQRQSRPAGARRLLRIRDWGCARSSDSR